MLFGSQFADLQFVIIAMCIIGVFAITYILDIRHERSEKRRRSAEDVRTKELHAAQRKRSISISERAAIARRRLRAERLGLKTDIN